MSQPIVSPQKCDAEIAETLLGSPGISQSMKEALGSGVDDLGDVSASGATGDAQALCVAGRAISARKSLLALR